MVTKPAKEPRPKRAKTKAVAQSGADHPLPTADALALIAANVSKGTDLEPRLAVDYALKLWKNSREKLESEMMGSAPVPEKNAKTQKGDGNNLPPAFPVPFDAFLQLVVNGQTLADSTNRFRDFLRNTSANEVEADKRLAKFADEGFKDAESWQVTALEYRHWWESRELPATGKSAETHSSAPKTSLPTFDTFLQTVVKGENDDESKKRFHAFLCSKFPEPEADEQMARLGKEGFKDIGTWLKTSRDYRDWCKADRK